MFRLLLRVLVLLSRWGFLLGWLRACAEWLYCWRHGVQRVPFGSTAVVSLYVGNHEIMSGPAPAELFNCNSFLMPRLRTVLQPGELVRLTVQNANGYPLPVSACIVCAGEEQPADEDGTTHIMQTMLPFPGPTQVGAGETLPLHVLTQPTRALCMERLLVAFPKYVKKGTFEVTPMDGPGG
jgi:hypothetical protein